MERRDFLLASLAAAIANTAHAKPFHRPPRILLRSSWQTVNIGDIAHTPGVLALIEKYIPEAETILWASGDLSESVAAMERKRFPKLKIVKGTIGSEGTASNKELNDAISWCDFLLHGSGPSLVAAKDLAAFANHIGKPYGVTCPVMEFGPDGAFGCDLRNDEAAEQFLKSHDLQARLPF